MNISKENIEAVLPFTEMQLSILTSCLDDWQNPDYIEQIAVTLDNGLIELLRNAWDTLSQRHPALRTLLRWKKLKNPVRVVLKEYQHPIQFYEEKSGNVCDWMEQERREGISLSFSPYRVCCVKCSSDRYVVIITYHHILYDGWSSSILVRDLLRLMQNGAGNIEDGEDGYISDGLAYAGKENKNNDEFWAGYLKGYPFSRKNDMVALYTRHNVHVISRPLSQPILYAVREAANKAGVTEASIYSAAWALAQMTLKQQDEIVIGTVFSGREGLGGPSQDIIGLFIRTLPIRLQAHHGDIIQIARDCCDSFKRVSENAAPIHKIKQAVGLSAESTLFQAFIIVENYPMDVTRHNDNDGCRIRELQFFDAKSMYPQTLEVIPQIPAYEKYGGRVQLKYWSDRIQLASANKILDMYLEIVESFLKTETEGKVLSAAPQGCNKSENEILLKCKEEFADILGIPFEAAEDDADFIRMGGHSLSVMMLRMRLQDLFPGLRLSISDMYRYTTPKLLGKAIALANRAQLVSESNEQIIPKGTMVKYPLSPAQKRLFFLNQLEQDSERYNLIEAYILTNIDVFRLIKAFTEVQQRHDCLHTRIVSDNGNIYQVLSESAKVVRNEIKPAVDIQDAISSATVKFDPMQDPELHIDTMQLTHGRTLFVLQFHHIFYDEWSHRIVMKEVADIYNGRPLKTPSPLRYFEYCLFMNETSLEKEKQREYWAAKLNAFTEPVELSDPQVAVPKNGQQPEGGEYSFCMKSGPVIQGIEAVCAAHNLTLFSVCFTLWVLTVHFLTGNTDLVLGTVSTGRSSARWQDVVGLFVNILPIRTQLRPDESLLSLFEKVQLTLREALENQDFPFDEMLDVLSIERKPDKNPILNISVVMQTDLPPVLEGMEAVAVERKTAKHDITLFIRKQEKKINFKIEYRKSCFTEAFIQNLAQRYLGLMNRMQEEDILSACLVHDHAIRTPSLNVGIFKSIQQAFRNTVYQCANKTAVIFGDTSMSYRELGMAVNSLAFYIGKKVSPGDNIAIYMDNGPWTLISVYAVLTVGCAYVPLDIHAPQARRDYMLNDSGCKIVLTCGVSDAAGFECIDVSTVPQTNGEYPVYPSGPEDIAYIIYTSGTTGEPKGCQCKQRGVVNYITWAYHTYFENREVFFPFFTSIAYDMTVTSLLPTTIGGKTVVVFENTIDAVCSVLEHPKINMIKVTPTHLRLAVGMKVCARINTFIVGGEQFHTELAERIFDIYGENVRIFNEYGPTETVVGCIVHLTRPHREKSAAVPIGYPIDHMDAYILDDKMALCKQGETGELYLSGEGVARGYLNKTELTQRAFLPDPFAAQKRMMYKTGDLVYQEEDGCFTYVGRRDNQVKIRGHRVELDEIVRALSRHDAVLDVYVHPQADKQGFYFLTAYYTVRYDVSEAELREFCGKQLPSHMVPSYFKLLKKLPYSASGKLDTHALPAVDRQAVKAETAETIAAEKWMRGLWNQILGEGNYDNEDRFFDAGGNSFLLLRLHSMIKEKYPHVELSDLFSHSSLGDMVRLIGPQMGAMITNTHISGKNDESAVNNKVAVVGISLRLKDAVNLGELARRLEARTDFVGDLSESRKRDAEAYLEWKGLSHYKINRAAYLEHIDLFDNIFFKISKKEAELMDPYQRILLEEAWKAFEDAGYTREKLSGGGVGVFVGHPYSSGYYSMVKETESELAVAAGPGNIDSVIAGRLSYTFNLNGPSMMIDTACSSSLVALHEAVRSILVDKCELAVAAGINLLVCPWTDPAAPVPDIVSSTARARVFDRDADGTGRGEGAVVLVLKEYSAALRDKDDIYAVILGSACNSDGVSASITAPNPDAQRKVVEQAWIKAGTAISNAGYIECHGTGTSLGDPLEIMALKHAFPPHIRPQKCAVGAIKSNYGHLDSAAGLLGVAKMIMSLRNQRIYPNANMLHVNPKIDFADSPFYPPRFTHNWDTENMELRTGGVSAFGLSGTNCHVVMQEAPSLPFAVPQDDSNDGFLFVLSAKTESALKAMLFKQAAYLKCTRPNPRDYCFTLQTGREAFSLRAALVFRRIDELIDTINGLMDADPFMEYKRDCVFLGNSGRKRQNEKKEFIPGSNLYDVAQAFAEGACIQWSTLYPAEQPRRLHIPGYEFDPIRCWLSLPEAGQQSIKKEVGVLCSVKTDISEKTIIAFVAEMFSEDPKRIDPQMDFFSLGLDSISILQLTSYCRKTFEVDIDPASLINNIKNIRGLALYIEEMKPTAVTAEAVIPEISKENGVVLKAETDSGKIVTVNNNGALLEKVVYEQLEIMKKQLELLGPDRRIPQPVKAAAIQQQNVSIQKPVFTGNALTAAQKEYLSKFILMYEKKMGKSKGLAGTFREKFASGRTIRGFSPMWKEFIFPIVAQRMDGAHLWDVDENEYVDFVMGFGVHLFGHRHQVISRALREQAEEGFSIGAFTELPIEVATLISRMTGVDRVAFCNSGTEAVMNMMRIARAATGKDKIVVFQSSFHGTFDGVYVQRDTFGQSVPVSFGTPDNMAQDIIVLDYGTDESLNAISALSQELAAILVEPAQSRHPDLQPVDFLKKLRKIADENQCLLLFDEVISGFRIHQGGAQAYFGVKADMVTYGKVVAGGLPIGIYAGKKKYMDLVDGGSWSYGDDTMPNHYLVQTGGTFSHHPLAMRTALATLTYLYEREGKVQEALNQKTEEMALYLNEFFQRYQVPLKMEHAGSQFIFASNEVTLLRFLYFHLLYHNIFVWEGGTCYLSVAHTDSDICRLVCAIQKICRILNDNGCFSFGTISQDWFFDTGLYDTKISLQRKIQIECCVLYCKNQADRNQAALLMAENENMNQVLPLTDMQVTVLAQNINLRASLQDIVFVEYQWKGRLDKERFVSAWTQVVKHYDILRTSFRWHKFSRPVQCIWTQSNFEVEICECEPGNCIEELTEKIRTSRKQCRFGKEAKSLFHVILVKRYREEEQDEFRVILNYQNSLLDGWSINIVLADFLRFYESGEELQAYCEGDCSAMRYWSYLNHRSSEQSKKDFWLNQLKGYSGHKPVILSGKEYDAGVCRHCWQPNELENINAFAKRNSITVNTLFLGIWALCLAHKEAVSKILVPIVVTDRSGNMEGSDQMVGLFTNMLPVLICVNRDCRADGSWFREIQQMLLQMQNYYHIPLRQIAQLAGIKSEVFDHEIHNNGFVYIGTPNMPKRQKTDFQISLLNDESYPRVPKRLYVDVAKGYELQLRYDKKRYSDQEAAELINDYVSVLQELISGN